MCIHGIAASWILDPRIASVVIQVAGILAAHINSVKHQQNSRQTVGFTAPPEA